MPSSHSAAPPVLLVAAAATVLATALLAAATESPPPSSFPRGHVHPLLHAQALSHLALHSPPFQIHTASLFAPPRTVCIVGVEWGKDAQAFAAAGFRVHAVEPVAKFVRHLRAKAGEPAAAAWDLRVHAFAAANASGAQVTLRYDNQNVVETVETRRLDDLLAPTRDHALAVLSVDVQGDELHVLQGASALLPAAVAALWVEAFSCHEKVAAVMDLLDEHYVLFDFVPWGQSSAEPVEQVPRSLASFAFEPDRPGEFHRYLDWMCHEKETGFRWLQTDLLAVRRDLVDAAWPQLAALGETQCGREGVNCLLRNLRAEAAATAEHEDL